MGRKDHNMKKKLFALFLCLMLCLTMLPVCAFAGDGLIAVSSGGSPLTGDESNIALWIVVAVVALAAIVGIITHLIRKRK